MTSGQAGLGYASALLVAWFIVHALVGHSVALGATLEVMPSWPEVAIIEADLFVARWWLPFLVLTTLLAPVGVVLFWFVRKVPPEAIAAPEGERRQLRDWLVWLSVVVILAAGTAVVAQAWHFEPPMPLLAWLLLAYGWSNAEALHRALRVQRAREGRRHRWLTANRLAVLAVGATLTVQPLGWLIPAWALWSSRAGRLSA